MRSNVAGNLDQDIEAEVDDDEHEKGPEEIAHVVLHDLVLFEEVKQQMADVQERQQDQFQSSPTVHQFYARFEVPAVEIRFYVEVEHQEDYDEDIRTPRPFEEIDHVELVAVDVFGAIVLGLVSMVFNQYKGLNWNK